ncbi:endonuclease [Pseudomethylobacillus aquaticus]|uniref:Endonuclease n=1 Tax=Pseudomethylobacillus aquaticus TaxID=2676064 RepID=A0A3N0V6H2_9PROT|nr:YqaJ viral recombinase family protein [Pseudomethylobacillus aquaticus]ROH87968.1 endonuclease [Pseudomethylobacillus aquaticus]
MEIRNLTQGSPEWHAHRAQHFNASDAPAMMGVSPYKTRSELLHQYATGIAPEVDEYTQRRFDDGHRSEALARPLAEQIIGEDVYPVTGTTGKYSASFDGLTIDERIGFEHKKLSARLHDLVWLNNAADFLPDDYLIQMEQQCMVSGAERILFMASDWDGYDRLLAYKTCWYVPDLDRRQRIVDGWEQFAKDLSAYAPEETAVKPVAQVTLQLPAVTVQTQGQIIVHHNLDAFGVKLKDFVANLNTKPETDQDFSDAEAAVKILGTAEVALKAAEANALAQASSLEDLRRTVSGYLDTARMTRLMLEKLVKTEKENRKASIVLDAKRIYESHTNALQGEIDVRVEWPVPDFASAIRGLKTLASIKSKCADTLATAKAESDALARDMRVKLSWFAATASEYRMLFSDLRSVITKPEEDFKLLVQSRIDQHKQLLEAREKRIRDEAEARLKAEQQAQTALQAEAAKVDALAASVIKADDALQPTSVSFPSSSAGDPASPAITTTPAMLQSVVVENQDVISAFLKSRNFGEREASIRAVLVEFVKFETTYNMKKAA